MKLMTNELYQLNIDGKVRSEVFYFCFPHIPGGGSHIKVKNLLEALQLSSPQHLLNNVVVESQHQPRRNKVKVAVLVSGTGELSFIITQRNAHTKERLNSALM